LFGVTGGVGKNLVLLTASACDHESRCSLPVEAFWVSRHPATAKAQSHKATEIVSKDLSLLFCHLFRYRHLDFFLLHLFGHAKKMLVRLTVKGAELPWGLPEAVVRRPKVIL